jgi:hypothetical protein
LTASKLLALLDGFLGEVSMENVPSALAGRVPATGLPDRAHAPLAAWTMSKSRSVSPAVENPNEQTSVIETKPDKPQLPSGFTLRVKPDRRRAQLPIPAGLDRRRPR